MALLYNYIFCQQCLVVCLYIRGVYHLPQLLGHKQHARNTSFKVVSILTNLDSAKATGCDDLSVRFIEVCPLAMAKLLTRVINKSISSCTFPSHWKYAVVTPVPKSRNNSASYN